MPNSRTRLGQGREGADGVVLRRINTIQLFASVFDVDGERGLQAVATLCRWWPRVWRRGVISTILDGCVLSLSTPSYDAES